MSAKELQDTLQWYNQNASRYAKSIQSFDFSDQIDDMILLLPSSNKKVLDAGCAAGRDCKRLAEKGLQVTGIDISPDLIAIAQKELPYISFFVTSFLKLPFPDSSFGGIWSHAALLHCKTVEDVKQALTEFHRVLVEGGILHLYLKENTNNKKFDVVSDSLSKHKRFFQYFTNHEIKNILQETGFTLIKMSNEEDRGGRVEVKWNLSLSRK